MAPTPKKRHSTYRKGKRRNSKKTSLPEVVYDKATGKPRLAHRMANPSLVAQKEEISKTAVTEEK